MKSFVQILEALPIPGFKPASPVRSKGPAKPAQPQRLKAKVMTPKGRVTTVKKPQSMRKPGYALLRYELPDGEKPKRQDHHDRWDKHPKKPIKPVSYGRSIAELTHLIQQVENESY